MPHDPPPPGCQTLAALLLACSPELPDQPLTVLTREDDGTYVLAAREIPTLNDPVRLEGDLVHGWAGGTLKLDGYQHGAPLRIDALTLPDDSLLATDEDGLVLWSFAAHLGDAVQQLDERGFDTSPIFPVTVAFSPASFMDFAAVENAAYVLGQRTFIIYPDALDNIPLAGNAGVVRHEFGHAWFELLVSGESGGAIPWINASADGGSEIRSLNEGFADTVAATLLDDPRFIDASLVLPERDLTQDTVATGLYPDSGDDPLAPLTYDPYALGSVYAAFAWDVREATDPDTALALAVGAVQAWGEDGVWEDADRYVLHFIDLADGPARDAACASAAVRFPHLTSPDCP